MTHKYRDPQSKLKHIDACLLKESQYDKSNGLDTVELLNEPGLDISLTEIDISTQFCGHEFSAPIMIAPMTGGIKQGAMLNGLWAQMAQHFRIPMSVGSQRIAIEQGDRAGFFNVRKNAPTAFIFSNLGAGNLRKASAVEMATKAVEMVEANAIFIHFNAMQEACQKGDTDFREALGSLELICAAMKNTGVKVFAREVGFGMSYGAVKRFIDAGVDGVDCSGAGGTSWSKVEGLCSADEEVKRLSMVFAEWGIPTATSIKNVRTASSTIPLVASGGIRNGLDVAKAIYLGADMVAMARPMLIAATLGERALMQFIDEVLLQLRVALFGCGAKSLASFKAGLDSWDNQESAGKNSVQ